MIFFVFLVSFLQKLLTDTSILFVLCLDLFITPPRNNKVNSEKKLFCVFCKDYGRNILCYLRSNRLSLCYLKCVICGAKLGLFAHNNFYRTLCYVIVTISLLQFVAKPHQKQWDWGSSTVSQTTRTKWTFYPLNQIRGEKVHWVKSIIFQPIKFEHCTCGSYCIYLPFKHDLIIFYNDIWVKGAKFLWKKNRTTVHFCFNP